MKFSPFNALVRELESSQNLCYKQIDRETDIITVRHFLQTFKASVKIFQESYNKPRDIHNSVTVLI